MLQGCETEFEHAEIVGSEQVEIGSKVYFDANITDQNLENNTLSYSWSVSPINDNVHLNYENNKTLSLISFKEGNYTLRLMASVDKYEQVVEKKITIYKANPLSIELFSSNDLECPQ